MNFSSNSPLKSGSQLRPTCRIMRRNIRAEIRYYGFYFGVGLAWDFFGAGLAWDFFGANSNPIFSSDQLLNWTYFPRRIYV